jgi:dTDP-4-amino-4,6-dideoxygalactose transaminase
MLIPRSQAWLDESGLLSELASVNFDQLPPVEVFEQAFVKQLNAQAAWAVHQGRVALWLALVSLELQPGDQIILPGLICKTVVQAVYEAGGTPVFADIELPNCNVSPQAVRSCLSPKTRAIIAAHLYGNCCAIDELRYIADETGCILIEDCAHTLGIECAGKPVGSWGDFSIFSFNYDKPLSTGQGGMLVVNRGQLASHVQDIIRPYQRTALEEELDLVSGLFLQHALMNVQTYCSYLPTDYGERVIKEEPLIREKMHSILMTGNIVDKDALYQSVLARLAVCPTPRGGILSRLYTKLKRATRLARTATLLSRPTLLMNSLRATVGLYALRSLPMLIEQRNRNAGLFESALKGNPAFDLPVVGGGQAAFLRYTVINRTGISLAQITQGCLAEGFEVGNYNWPRPAAAYSRPLRQNVNAGPPPTLPITEHACQHLFHLPIHPNVQAEDVARLTDFLKTLNGNK